MVPDPYRVLGLGHGASKQQIKVAYRKLALQYHPDRLTARSASPAECQRASEHFAAISAAYQLLSDEQRKRQYDHIYKYGGYDEVSPVQAKNARPQQQESAAARPQTKQPKGIGYALFDPFTYMLTGKSRRAVAGVHIPSRHHFVHAPPGGGFRFAFSSGEISKSKDGIKKFVSKTTQFVQGKKYSRVETTTLHPDGRKETVIAGDDCGHRRFSTPPRSSKVGAEPKKSEENVTPRDEDEKPWYMGAWNDIRDRLSMCHNPCGTILVQ